MNLPPREWRHVPVKSQAAETPARAQTPHASRNGVSRHLLYEGSTQPRWIGNPSPASNAAVS